MAVRVVRIKLRTPTRTKAVKLEAMQREYAACATMHLDMIQELGTTNATKLHHAVYKEACTTFALPVVNIQRARDKAIEAFTSHEARLKRGRKSSPPIFGAGLPLGIGQRAIAFTNSAVRISTEVPRKYIWLPFVLDKTHTATLAALAAGSIKYGACEIQRRADDWFVSITVYEDVPVARVDGPVFGLDLGLANTAVLSGPKLVRFWSGHAVRHVRNRYSERRRQLQRAGLRKEVRRSKNKESRWMRDTNHKIARQIINLVSERGGTLGIEKLLGIRDRVKLTRKVNRMVHSWAFGELIALLKEKGDRAGVSVVEVDPRHTSQRCRPCGYTERGNRTTQAEFHCKACGYRAHADYNASGNIAALVPGYTSGTTGGLTLPGRKTRRNRKFGATRAGGKEAGMSKDRTTQSHTATSQVPLRNPLP